MNNIARYRGYKNMSQEKLAELMGLSRTQISVLENMNRKGKPKKSPFGLTMNNAKKIADIFGVTVVEVYGEENFICPPINDYEKEYIIDFLYKSMDSKTNKIKLLDRLRDLDNEKENY
ncbi:helix-turn-helix transcriptional regulator [Mammaliicoccus vitulinus]|uniref:helix-turn-helix transcriptional regulator n=1 Tax=Mammaliicoccus vitulinus TaxID=71237 RepID=UPI00248B9CB3|nr:helix-turn-helix transcriptional regulator [Mammaliicoccus vitulinus]